MGQVTHENLDEVMTYHKPTPERAARHEALNTAESLSPPKKGPESGRNRPNEGKSEDQNRPLLPLSKLHKNPLNRSQLMSREVVITHEL